VFLWLAVLLESGVGDVKNFVERDLLQGRYLFVGTELGLDKRWLSENCPAPETSEGREGKLRAIVVGAMLQKALQLVGKLSRESRALVLANYVEIALHEFVHANPEQIFSLLNCFHDFL
jgi:hypothetical protein